MKIAVVSSSDKTGGGASKVADDLSRLMRARGHVVHHYRKENYSHDGLSFSLYGKWEAKHVSTHKKLKKIGFQELIPFDYLRLSAAHKIENYDLVHIHDMTLTVSPFAIKWLSKKLPLVWTMHDCSPVTGGCVNPLDCTHYLSKCFSCPQKAYGPMQGGKHDLAFFHRWLKKGVHRAPIHLVSPSRWLKDFALSTTLVKRPIAEIPNGVETDVYYPGDKRELRKSLGLDPDRFTILLTSRFIGYKSKGINYAIDVLKRIKHLNPHVVIVGNLGIFVEKMFAGFDYTKAGFVSEYDKLNQWYGAADIFLNCSIAENFPLVVLESAAAGTPTFGFRVGGMVEMVKQDQTGCLVDLKDTPALASAIEKSYSTSSYRSLGENARKFVVANFTLEAFADRYEALFEKVIENFKR